MEIKAISASNQVKVEVEAELDNKLRLSWVKLKLSYIVVLVKVVEKVVEEVVVQAIVQILVRRVKGVGWVVG